MSAIPAIARADARALGRDPLLRAMLVAPIGLTGLLTIGIPVVEGWLSSSYGIDLSPHRPVLITYLTAVVLPLLFGGFAGLLLLEDRESGVLPAVAVSPAGVRIYLLVRMSWAGVAATVAVIGALLLESTTPPDVALVAAVLAGAFAAVVGLLIGGLASDRLEGIAVTKATMLPLSAVLLVAVIDTPWTLALAALPSYAPAVVLLDGLDGRSIWAITGFGVVQLGIWTWLLARRIVHRIG